MNQVTLIGRLTKDPELRYTKGSGKAVTSITVAVDSYGGKNGEKTADFIPVVVWGKQAENLATYTSKGTLIAVKGKIKIRNYEDAQGNKKYVTEVLADNFEGIKFLGSKSNNSSQSGNNQNSYNNQNNQNSYNNQNQNVQTPNYESNFDLNTGLDDFAIVDDGDMPF